MNEKKKINYAVDHQELESRSKEEYFKDLEEEETENLCPTCKDDGTCFLQSESCISVVLACVSYNKKICKNCKYYDYIVNNPFVRPTYGWCTKKEEDRNDYNTCTDWSEKK